MRIVPFDRRRLVQAQARGESSDSSAFGLPLDAAMLAELERRNSWAVVDAEDRAVAVGGLWEHWPGRTQCWAYLPAASGPAMLKITRLARRLIEGAGPGRFEMDVRADFAPGHRWANMLGFEVEGLKRRFGPDGSDFMMYARIQG